MNKFNEEIDIIRNMIILNVIFILVKCVICRYVNNHILKSFSKK